MDTKTETTMTDTIDYEHCKDAAAKLGARQDCGVRAVACATQTPYADVRDFLISIDALRQCGGIKWHGLFEGVNHFGFGMIQLWDDDEDGRRQVRSMLKSKMFSKHGTYIVHTRGHVFCVRHGTIEDWQNENRRHVVQAVWQITTTQVNRLLGVYHHLATSPR
jgi:hypothetical protein